jgi:hypothetical protein
MITSKERQKGIVGKIGKETNTKWKGSLNLADLGAA